MIEFIIILLGVLLAIIIVGLFYAGIFLVIYFTVGLFIHGSLQAAVSLMLLFMILIVGRL